MQFKNLTPHALNIYKEVVGKDGKPTGETVLAQTLSPSGTVARCEEKSVYCWSHTTTGIDMYRISYGDVALPDYEDGVFLVVSFMVRQALPERSDLCSPGRLLRNSEGQPIGCVGLYLNKQ